MLKRIEVAPVKFALLHIYDIFNGVYIPQGKRGRRGKSFLGLLRKIAGRLGGRKAMLS